MDKVKRLNETLAHMVATGEEIDRKIGLVTKALDAAETKATALEARIDGKIVELDAKILAETNMVIELTKLNASILKLLGQLPSPPPAEPLA